MVTVYVSVGSNIERERHIRSGVAALKKTFGELVLSSLYESAAVGFDGNDFLNLIVAFDTSLPAKQVGQLLTTIEKENGRTLEQRKFNPRTLDLDMVLYGALVSQDSRLNIPRDEITRYAFVLEPLAEIAGELHHPVLNITYAELWRTFDKRNLSQQKITFSF